MEWLLFIGLIGFFVLLGENDSNSYSNQCKRGDTYSHWSPGPSYYRTNEHNEWDI